MSTAAPSPATSLDDPESIVDTLLHGNPLGRADVYDLYAALRAQAPILRSEHGMWVLTRAGDVHAALRHKGTSMGDALRASPRFETSLTLQMFAASMLFIDDPAEHARQRKLVRQAFTRQTVRDLEPFIARLVGGLLDECAERGTFDFVDDFATRIPVDVICEMLGVPSEDFETFRAWNFAITQTSAAAVSDERLAAGDEATGKLREYMQALLEERKSAPRDDLISALIRARDEGDQLTDEETLSLAILLLAAGSDTTTAFLGAAVAGLMDHPDQLQALRGDPASLADALEELLRYAGPVHFGIMRLTTEPLVLPDVEIPAGEQVWTILAAANRDPDRFERPDDLDLSRGDVSHWTLGQGMHLCLGAMLARLEARVALGAFLERFPRLEPEYSEVGWYDHGNLRGIRDLRLRAA